MKSTRIYLSTFTTVILCVLAAAAASAQSNTIVELSCDDDVTQWYLGRRSERVYAFSKGDVFVFDSNGEKSHIKLKGVPLGIVEKSDQLVIGTRSPSQLVLINLQNDSRRTLPLPTASNFLMTASDADNPWIYVIELGMRDSRLIQINVATAQIQNTDSSWLPIRKTTYLTPSGEHFVVDSMVVEFNEKSFKRGKVESTRHYNLKPDPQDRNWMVGNQRLDRDYVEHLVNYSGKNAAFHPKNQSVLSIVTMRDDDRPLLIVESRSDAKLIAGIRLKKKRTPQEESKVSRTRSPSPVPIGELQISPDGSRLLYTRQRTATIVDLSILNKTVPSIKDSIAILPIDNRIAHVNEEYRVPIKVESNSDAVELRLEVGPSGAKISDGNQLVWQPTGSDLGQHIFKLSATSPKASTTYEFDVDAIVPHANLGEDIYFFDIDSKGKHAVTYLSRSGKLSVIDLDSMVVATEKRINERANSVHIEEDRVFHASRGSHTIVWRDRDSLALKKKRSLIAVSEILGSTSTMVMCYGGGTNVLSLRDLFTKEGEFHLKAGDSAQRILPGGFVQLGKQLLAPDGSPLNQPELFRPSVQSTPTERRSSHRFFIADRVVTVQTGLHESLGRFNVSLHDLAGKELDRLSIPCGRHPTRMRSFGMTADNRLVFSLEQKLLRYNMPQAIIEQLPRRVQLVVPEQPLRKLAPTITIPLEIKHATDGVDFVLPENEHISIDPDGKLTLDIKGIWAQTEIHHQNASSGPTRYGIFRESDAVVPNVPADSQVVTTTVYVGVAVNGDLHDHKTFDLRFVVPKDRFQTLVKKGKSSKPQPRVDDVASKLTRIRKKLFDATQRLDAIEKKQKSRRTRSK